MSSLERAESLEQLRWLQNGYKIQVVTTDFETVGIDTPDDLQRAEAFIRNRRWRYFLLKQIRYAVTNVFFLGNGLDTL